MEDWRKGGFDTHIVILGGGFAGVYTARQLVKNLRRQPSVHVTLVNDQNYFVFQPLLPEVAAGTLEATTTVNPIRQLIPDVDFDCATVASIDVERRLVHLEPAEGQSPTPMPFDHLVLAMGTVPNLELVPGVAEHGLPMKNLADAFRLRHHVIHKLEQAANEAQAPMRKELLSIVVIGGGFSGVETAAELHEAMKKASHHYPEIGVDEPVVTIVQSGDRILPELSTKLSAKAKQILDARPGIEIVLNDRVVSVTPTSATLQSGRVIHTRTVVCTVGNRPNPLITAMGLPMKWARLKVEADLRVEGCDNIWALGDLALAPNAAEGGAPCPPTAQFAMRQGKVCADNIYATLNGTPTRPFKHVSQGMMASLGLHSAVAELTVLGRPLRFSGFIAWWMWRTVYVMKLPGWFRRLRVVLDWTLDLLFRRDLVNLDVSKRGRVARGHYDAGQAVITQGDIALNFYIIQSGNAEVVQAQNLDGVTVERVLARLGPGDHFGDDALQDGGRRLATVRALTPLDICALDREDFGVLVDALAPMRRALEEARLNRAPPELKLLQEHHTSWLQRTQVAAVMSAEPLTLPLDTTVGALFDLYCETRHSSFPVVDDQNQLCGLVTRTDLHRAINAGVDKSAHVQSIMNHHLVCVFGDEPVQAAVTLMEQRKIKRVLVVDRDHPRRLLGLLSPTDLFKAQLRGETSAPPAVA